MFPGTAFQTASVATSDRAPVMSCCALVAGLHFHIFLPTLKVGTRVVGERLDEGDSWGGFSHGLGRVVEWVVG